jgi:hypothetical protein
VEDSQLPPSLDHHARLFKRPPRLLAGDWGVHTTANEQYTATHGVKEVVLPKPGAKSAKRLAHEQQRTPQAESVTLSQHYEDGTLGWLGRDRP